MQSFNDIPLINNLIPGESLQRQSTEDTEILKMRSHYFDQIKQNEEEMENFKQTSKELLRLGFDRKHILHSFLVYRYKTPEEGIDLLSQSEGIWNHRYVDCNEKCFICQEDQSSHISLELKLKKLQSERPMSKQMSVHVLEDLQHSIKVSNKECDICFGELSQESYTLSCKHEYCRECIVYYIEEEIRNSRVEKIICPGAKCENTIDQSEIKTLVGEKDYCKYQKFLARLKLKDQKDVIPCPIVDCEGTAKKESTIDDNVLKEENENLIVKDNTRLVCDRGHPFCSNCMQAWHRDSPCEDDNEIKDYATFSGSIVKKCPSCKVWTEKNEGCNHMTCRECKYEWCWLCEQECLPNHYSIRGTPCYGRMMGDIPDPNMDFFMLLNDRESFMFSFFFLHIISFYLLSTIIRNIYYRNNGVRRIVVPSKWFVFFVIAISLTCLLVFLLFANGYILITMLCNMSKLSRMRSIIVKFLVIVTFSILWIVYLFFGMYLLVIWYVILLVYAAVKLCSA